MGSMLALIVMDGRGLEPGTAVEMSFIYLLQPVAQEENGDDGREDFLLLSLDVEH